MFPGPRPHRWPAIPAPPPPDSPLESERRRPAFEMFGADSISRSPAGCVILIRVFDELPDRTVCTRQRDHGQGAEGQGEGVQGPAFGRRDIRDAERVERRQCLHARCSRLPGSGYNQRGYRVLSGAPRLRGSAYPGSGVGGDPSDCPRGSGTGQRGRRERLWTHPGGGGRDHPPGGGHRCGRREYRRLCRRLWHG